MSSRSWLTRATYAELARIRDGLEALKQARQAFDWWHVGVEQTVFGAGRADRRVCVAGHTERRLPHQAPSHQLRRRAALLPAATVRHQRTSQDALHPNECN